MLHSWNTRTRASASFLLLVCLSACAVEPNLEQSSESSDGNDLIAVDCLLPGQIRQLGAKTYLSARRPIKTSARDCQIRGGEYVAYDRASYATALKVWLPLAKSGDTEAIVNVGEIHEKGLGLSPDYKAAAHWYSLAAEKGNSRAQINLGHLYEKGLGVERDPDKALYWYRLASGIKDNLVLDPGTIDVPEPVALSQQPDMREDFQREVERLRHETDALHKELDKTREQLEHSRRELEQHATTAEPAHKTTPVSTEETEKRAKLVTAMQEKEEQLQVLEARIKQHNSQTGALQSDLDKALNELTSVRYELERSRLDSDARSLELQQARGKLTTYEQNTAATKAETARLEQLWEQRESEIARQRSDMQRLQMHADMLEKEVAVHQGKLATQETYDAAIQQRSLAGPSITMIDPLVAGTRGAPTPTVMVRGNLKTRQIVGRLEIPAGLLSLTVNDNPGTVNAQGIFQVHVPLNGPSVPVSIVAIDNQGKRDNTDFILQSEPGKQDVKQTTRTQEVLPLPAIDFGNFHALVIGIDNYRQLPKLRTAVNDANAVADLLQRRYGFKVTKLLNATRYDILSALNEMREQLTSNDNLLIYYAGHGELDRVNMRGHWLPADAELENTANWLSNVAVTDILNIIKAKELLVVADSCYSGSLTRSALSQLEGGLTDKERLNWLKTMSKKRSRTVLTSGGLEPTLDEGGGNHSVFAKALLDVLQSNNQILDGRHLYQEVSAKVAYAASRLRFEQVPEYAPIKYTGHEGGDFFLVPVL